MVIFVVKEIFYNFCVCGYIFVVFGCFFEGYDVLFYCVVEIVIGLFEMGVDEIVLGDMIGMGIVFRIKDLLNCLRSVGIRNEDVVMYFYDMYG